MIADRSRVPLGSLEKGTGTPIGHSADKGFPTRRGTGDSPETFDKFCAEVSGADKWHAASQNLAPNLRMPWRRTSFD